MRIFRELEPSEGTDASAAEQDGRVRDNLAAIRTIVGFGSARGGVGKSALAINTAATLALLGRKVGILDADLNSPSIVAMLGMKTGRRAFTSAEVEPGAGPLGLRVVSSEFLPEGEPPPVSFVDLDEPSAGVPQNGAHPNELGFLATMRRLLGATRFGPLDLLLVDLAPGLEQIYRLLKLVPSAGIVLACHPSELSARSIRSAIDLALRNSGAMIGVVENMAGFNCDGCHVVRPLMPYGSVGTFVREAAVPLLERLPFDPRFAETCDRGVIFVREYPDTPLAKQLVALANSIGKSARARFAVEASPSA
ncbi:MAG TPA: P-loop NTPase [Candidatus Binataceae bacterium]|nr:P-loop NTPase [Candidatus Binataceae bacterium]